MQAAYTSVLARCDSCELEFDAGWQARCSCGHPLEPLAVMVPADLTRRSYEETKMAKATIEEKPKSFRAPIDLTALTREDLMAPFAQRVVTKGPNDCWDWTGMHDMKPRYARYRVWKNGKAMVIKAHRAAYALAHPEIPLAKIQNGEIRKKWDVCTRTDCVNPAHWVLVSNAK